MSVTQSRMGLLAACLMGAAGISPARAALPSMTAKEWLGYFVVVQNRAFQFGFTSEGKATIHPMGKKGGPVGNRLMIPVSFQVLETMPDGGVISRKIRPESLESAQPASDKPRNVVIRGKVTGDAGFEISINEERGWISLGGRLLDPGKSENPLRFVIELKIPDVYGDVKAAGDKEAAKAFEERAKRDRLQLVWTDEKRVRPSLTGKVDAAGKEIQGPGIAAIQLELGAYDDKKIEVTASPNSSITLANKSSAPLIEGFSITWAADSAKDPEGKARLGFVVK